jgi:hypothetical protein
VAVKRSGSTVNLRLRKEEADAPLPTHEVQPAAAEIPRGEAATCPRCGQAVWDYARRCPHCGVHFAGEAWEFKSPSPLHRSRSRRGVILVVVGLMVLALLLAVVLRWAL